MLALENWCRLEVISVANQAVRSMIHDTLAEDDAAVLAVRVMFPLVDDTITVQQIHEVVDCLHCIAVRVFVELATL